MKELTSPYHHLFFVSLLLSEFFLLIILSQGKALIKEAGSNILFLKPTQINQVLLIYHIIQPKDKHRFQLLANYQELMRNH